MATIGQLKKAADERLFPCLASHGFRAGKGCSYFRVTQDGLYQFVIFDLTSGGAGADVFITCTIPEVHKSFDEKKLPPADMSILVGGDLSYIVGVHGNYIGNEYSARLDKEGGMEKYFSCVVPWIEKCVIPFFDSMSTRRQFWDELPDATKAIPRIAAAKSLFDQ
jgi:hypothetical protein